VRLTSKRRCLEVFVVSLVSLEPSNYSGKLENSSSCKLTETTLKGLIIILVSDMKDALDYINTSHTPLYKKLSMEGRTLGWTSQEYGTLELL